MSLSSSSETLVVGKTLKLSANITPSSLATKTITWNSNNNSVATVDSTGLVKAISPGSATITASVDGKSASCTIKVNAATVKVSSISLTSSKGNLFYLNKNTSTTLSASIRPADATNKAVIWSSSNTNVATVDNSGKITAVKGGSATITATTQDEGKTATCSVKVNPEGINVDIGDWGDGGSIGGGAN